MSNHNSDRPRYNKDDYQHFNPDERNNYQYSKIANENRAFRGPPESDWESESNHRNQPDFHQSERRTPYGQFHGAPYSAFYDKSQHPKSSSEGRDYLHENLLPEDISRHYAGRGPKNFKRTDERIREEICDKLTDDPHVDAHDIEVLVMEGYVTLNGTVPEKRMKRMTEELIEQIRDVKDIHNNIKIKKDEEREQTP
ncbi:BON domain-containing protein [Bdellovibrio reynosensis]|uniref:BON domain-containing protein n=1 Tax=Bdellovibrio reynosensis TaxID=2835041 RepID=A0ABY4C7C8_9BACT|nr:BON domain-containing protein [Bdellovibrio reynosensis]UOF00798.1 BON domain-containing protein [Bdellovibrio reynosensis]